MALIATSIRLSAMAWLVAACLYGPAAQAFDARSPFGENGRDDWHSADHNWDGSPAAPLRIAPVTAAILSSPPKPLVYADKAVAGANPTPRATPVILVAANVLQSAGTAQPSSQTNNAIALVNTLLNNVTGTNLSRGVVLGSINVDTNSQATLPLQSRLNISH